MPLSSVSFFKPFILLFGFIAIVIFSKLNTKSRKKMNNELLFLFSRYVLLNIIFVFIYYFFCNDKSDWEYEKHSRDYDENKFFYAVYHTFMVSTTIGDIHPRSIRARTITLIQAMCDFYLFGNIIYYMSYREVNGF